MICLSNRWSFVPGEDSVVMICSRGKERLALFQDADGGRIASVRLGNGDVTFSPDRKYVAIAIWGREDASQHAVQLWARDMTRHINTISQAVDIKFSPHGRSIALEIEG